VEAAPTGQALKAPSNVGAVPKPSEMDFASHVDFRK
jgi:hypothetical protein